MPRPRIRPHPLVRLGGLLLLVPLALLTAQPAAAARKVPGRQALVFSDLFRKADWGRPGATWCPYSSAYPNGRTNPEDWKLDRNTAGALSLAEGGGLRFRATPVGSSPAGQWATGLITTEPWDGGSCGGDGFMLQPDDYVLVHLRLPQRAGGGGHGAWPGIWTWKDGGNEVDILEWHSELPDRAEFVNHVDGNTSAAVRSSLLGFGRSVWFGARLGTGTVTWYLGSSSGRMKAVYSDHRGVPADWQAYLVVNLSVSSQHGRAPSRRTPITAEVLSVRVYR